MRPESWKFLEDMRQAAGDIAQFTAGKSFADFLKDKQFRLAVERSFEVLGEALSQLNKTDPETARKITDWRDIIGFRNVLIHGYAVVDHQKTWDIVQTHLPLLQEQLTTLLG